MSTHYQWAGKAPAIGDAVVIPRTTPGHDVPRVGQMSRIVSISGLSGADVNIHGVPYVWIGLEPGDGVWASHMLGFKLTATEGAQS